MLKLNWTAAPFLCLLTFHATLLPARPWIWDPAQTAGSTPGGEASWNTTDSFWWNGSGNVTWPTGSEPAASVTDGRATVSGALATEALIIGADGEVRLNQGNFKNGNRLTVRGNLTGPGILRFHSDQIGGSLRYSDTLLNGGLHFEGGGQYAADVDFRGVNLFSSQILVVDGSDTEVTFSGLWRGHGGQAYPHLFLQNGGRFIFGDDAHLDFINNAFFTRQLWVKGEGTGEEHGRVEFAEGFVADLTEGGTVDDGFGSIRINNAVVVTHHSQSIPVGQRPRPGNPDGPQTNGHFVFENNPGRWIVKTHDQEYAGGVWIRHDVILETQTNLRHVGVTEDDNESSHKYRAGNAFQTNRDDRTMIKRGVGDLVLAGGQAYRSGTVFRVEEGTVVMETDPSAGYFHNSINSSLSPAGPDLTLELIAGGRAAFDAPVSSLKSIENVGGTLLLNGQVNLKENFTQNHAGSGDPTAGRTIVVLDDTESGSLSVDGHARLGGVLRLELADGFNPTEGMVFDILQATTLSGAFAEISSQPGLKLGVEQLSDRIRVTVGQTDR